MKYYGVDITQHKEYCLSADYVNGGFVCAKEARNSCLPAALLPEYKGERIQMSSEVKDSRKGLGLLWPREAQIPVGRNEKWKNGIGRVPLLACISNIKAAGDADEWKIIESQTTWTPHSQTLSFSNASLLSKVFRKIRGADQICFVLPEDFGESAQQTLLDKFPENTILIPRSIALAVKWCKDHQKEYQDYSFGLFDQSPYVGHLICASLGFGEWEVSLIEIQAVKYNEEVYLIPIYDPNMLNQGLNFCGIGLCSQLLKDPSDLSACWRRICNENWFDKILAEDLAEDTKKRITKALLDASQTQIPYQKLDIMSGLFHKHSLRGDIKRKINWCINSQEQIISSDINKLGVVVGGSFSKIPVYQNDSTIDLHNVCPPDSPFLRMNNQQLQHFVEMGVYQAKRVLQFRIQQISIKNGDKPVIPNYLFPKESQQQKLFIYGADVFAEGAAIASCCIGEGLPAYRIKLLPLYLYTIGRNAQGDKEEYWKTLVDDITLEAGQIYQQPSPITGLSIPEGKEHLELTLRRPGHHHEQLYRSVIAKIPQKTEQKEAVRITANVRPGQGFAKVSVVSERKGVFNTHLDWQTMKAVPKPVLRLEYIPNVATIVSDSELWNSASYRVQSFVSHWNQYQSIREGETSDLLSVIRIWRWDRSSSNIFRYVGVINNDGISANHRNWYLLDQFRSALCEAWLHSRSPIIRRRLLRIGGWLYLFIPDKMIKYAEKAIQEGDDSAIILHVAGLSFHTEKQLRLFYEAFCSTWDHKTDWFRALRNLVRFRDSALSKDVLSDRQINKILDTVIDNLKRYSTHYKRMKYNNSIEVLVYLLKRRRYDEDFLSAGDETTLELRDILHRIANIHPTEKYRRIAQETLAFLNREATADNLVAILEADDDYEGDDSDD